MSTILGASREDAELGEPIGFVVDGSTPVKLRFVSRTPPPLGDYITIRVGDSLIVGIVDNVSTRSITLSTAIEIYDPLVVSRIMENAGDDDVFFECSARLLGDPYNGFSLPRSPPLPGLKVYLAPDSLLRKIFSSPPPKGIRIGVLAARPSVPVYVDVNKLVTRHTAILAVTGAGKSNTVAVILDRLSELGATSLVMDFHGEYVDTGFKGRVNVLEPLLNPSYLSIGELMVLLGIEPKYYNQERVLRRAFEKAHSEQDGTPFLERLLRAVTSLRGREDPKAVAAVANKIEALAEKHRDILRDDVSDVVARIKLGEINVVDLSRVDEEAADAVASHYLRRILYERKRFKTTGSGGMIAPVLIVIEEAHVLVPRDRTTLSKYWVARIAREGRKFGVGLILVSQRPKNIDQDALSQMNNKIILRIVEPSDQKYVQASSETLSDDLLSHLPSLNTGEALLLGPFIPVPARVKIDKFHSRLGGADPDIVGEWMRYRRERSEEDEIINHIAGMIEMV
ncbi:MAG: ATP-binding protein [Pyrodictiaceae archaeon]